MSMSWGESGADKNIRGKARKYLMWIHRIPLFHYFPSG